MGLTEAQLAFRRGHIGGSEIAAVVGVNPYAGPHAVWLDKMGLESPRGENPRMTWGSLHEPTILPHFAKVNGVVARTAKEVWPRSVDGTLRSENHPVAGASPDGVVLDSDGEPFNLVQIKCAFERGVDAWGDSGDVDGVPQHVICQGVWEQLVAGVHGGHFVMLANGWDYRQYPMVWDADLAGSLLEEAEKFWRDFVVTKREPPVDGKGATSDWLARRFAKNNGRMLPPPAGAYDLALEYKRGHSLESEGKEIKEQAGNQLRALIGDADGFDAPGLKVTWKTQNGAPAYKAIAETLNAPAALIKQHTPTIRMLRVTVGS
jgi:putative phage-type endonuclease